jgi:hypothetical protein
LLVSIKFQLGRAILFFRRNSYELWEKDFEHDNEENSAEDTYCYLKIEVFNTLSLYQRLNISTIGWFFFFSVTLIWMEYSFPNDFWFENTTTEEYKNLYRFGFFVCIIWKEIVTNWFMYRISMLIVFFKIWFITGLDFLVVLSASFLSTRFIVRYWL